MSAVGAASLNNLLELSLFHMALKT